MINLRAVANQYTSAINPNVPAILKRNTGYITNDDGSRVPSYSEQSVLIQSQPMSSTELQLVESLGIQGYSRAVHINCNLDGVSRYNQTGADTLIFKQHNDSDVFEWKIVQVMESWQNWSRVLLCRQLT